MKHFLIAFALLLVAGPSTGCRDESSPKNTIGEEKFIAVYALLLTETRPGEAQPDSLAIPDRALIFEEQGVTEEKFRATLAWYNRNPKRWREFYKQVTRHLEERAAADTSTTVKQSAVQDSGWALRTLKLN